VQSGGKKEGKQKKGDGWEKREGGEEAGRRGNEGARRGRGEIKRGVRRKREEGAVSKGGVERLVFSGNGKGEGQIGGRASGKPGGSG